MASETYVSEQIEQAAKQRFASPECEENILRRMFKKRDEAEEVIEALSESDFTDESLGMLFSAVRKILQDGAQIDSATVAATFSSMYPLHADIIRDRMIGLVQHTPYTLADGQSIKDHIRIVKELSRRRTAISRMNALLNRLADPSSDMTATLSEIQDAAEEVDSGDAESWTSLASVNMTTYEYLDARTSGKVKAIPSGITSLDEIIGGLFGGELTIVAARPSVGKSAFGLNIALSAASDGFKVGFVSCEMDDKGFGQRTLSRGAWVGGDKLRKASMTQEDWDKLCDAMTDMQGLPIEFLFNRGSKEGITVENVFREVKRKAKHGEIDLLIVDYIGIMRTAKVFKEDRLRIAHISSELKRLAMVANIPVVALCQVNRLAQGRMPTMAELRDSGAVEQDADGIIFLHHPETHEDKSIHPKDVQSFYAMQEGGSAYIAIGVAKQRNGATGITQVIFDPAIMRYSEIMRE